MDTLLLFALETSLCLAISFALIWLLRPLLTEVLTETCGTEKRADFWVMFTQLMLVIAPLLIVVYYAPTESVTQFTLTNELRLALFRTLLGDFIALSAIGKVIWASIRSSQNQALQPAEEGV